MKETFVRKWLNGHFKGEEDLEQLIDSFIDDWHNSISDHRSLSDAIGFTQKEYSQWVHGTSSLKNILESKKNDIINKV